MSNELQEKLTASWLAKQEEIAQNVIANDDNDWYTFLQADGYLPERDLLIAGADISFSTTEADLAIGTITVVVLKRNSLMELVYSKSQKVQVVHPYIPTFLGFREAPVVSVLLRELPQRLRNRLDCLLLDGNGMLHPRKAGLACHVGVEEKLPTIGVSKTLLCVDGLIEKEVRELITRSKSEGGVEVIGKSGTVWARALLTGNAETKPIYISVGHRVSLNTAVRLVRRLCRYRVPEPIRMADQHSRALLRGEDIYVCKADEFL